MFTKYRVFTLGNGCVWVGMLLLVKSNYTLPNNLWSSAKEAYIKLRFIALCGTVALY
ncbi:hypothetical protein PS850_02459 [Pseudomonas fluorescens]|nr:hypothetical protein PS850_02459 [Pseudomonas fluorescens]